jgi:hypothetical protein
LGGEQCALTSPLAAFSRSVEMLVAMGVGRRSPRLASREFRYGSR